MLQGTVNIIIQKNHREEAHIKAGNQKHNMEKNISYGFIRFDMGEEKISTIEDTPLEIIQTEMQRKIREVRKDGEDIFEEMLVTFSKIRTTSY